MPEIILNGCAPIPLAHYLKALGILRIVAEQVDATAACWWRGDDLVLQSRLDRDGLVEFFLGEYCPSPLLNPWNGDGGFFADSRAGAIEVLSAVTQSKAPRFAAYRNTISSVRRVFELHGITEKPTDERKAEVLVLLRSALPCEAVDWIDAVAVLTESGPKYPPLLGSGGNDGSIDFCKNFLQRLALNFDWDTGLPTSNAENRLRASLFETPSPATGTADKIGQFFPGAAGGANATAGFDADPKANPWDYLLMMEGALLFAAASSKRLESGQRGTLVYPFCVNQVGAGYASATRADEEKAACEIWLPMWARQVTYPELRAVFNEGRAQVRGRPAADGVDFAVAAVTHGVDSGISAFYRYAILERNGQSNFATPLGKFTVRRNARADLLLDLHGWTTRLGIKTDPRLKKKDPQAKKAPDAVKAGFSLVERRIMDLCHDDSGDRMLALLAALGTTERAVARSFSWAKDKDKYQRENISPLRGLRPDWLERITNCTEVRLAASLASSRASFGQTKETLWFRQHLEPLERLEHGEWFKPTWSKLSTENDVAWHDGDLTAALNAILTRRLIRVEKSGAKGWPDWSPRPASLADITAFIERRTNDELLADLIWGLSLVDWARVPDERNSEATDEAVPSSFYALLRLCFRRANKGQEQNAIPLVPAILVRAMNGDGRAASELAARRLRASGHAPLVASLPVAGDVARRTAAAMQFPIGPRDFWILERTILQQTNTQNA